jgi:hypothetical protein
MNCLDFRRAVLTDPCRLDPAAARHAAQCSPCGEFYARSLEQEAELAQALRVPVPRGLTRRLVPTRSAWPVAAAGLAAAVVAAIALGWAVGWDRNDPLALAGIDFVVFEEAQTLLDAKPAKPDMLDVAAAKLGVPFPDFIGEMRYVCTFPFGDGSAYHVIARTAFGKATLMLLPGRPPAARAAATARGLTAVVAPAAGGSVTVIGRSSEAVERIVDALRL